MRRLGYALVTPFTKTNPWDRDFVIAKIHIYLDTIAGKIQDEGNDEDSLELADRDGKRPDCCHECREHLREEDIHKLLSKIFFPVKRQLWL